MIHNSCTFSIPQQNIETQRNLHFERVIKGTKVTAVIKKM